MFVIFLKLAENRQLADAHLAAHNDWIRQGVDDEAFLLVGSLSGGQGGARSSLTASPVRISTSGWKPTRSWPSGSWPPRSSRSTPAWSTTASPS